jgi:hypothetical protein
MKQILILILIPVFRFNSFADPTMPAIFTTYKIDKSYDLTFQWRREACETDFQEAIARLENTPSATVKGLGNIGVENALQAIERAHR